MKGKKRGLLKRKLVLTATLLLGSGSLVGLNVLPAQAEEEAADTGYGRYGTFDASGSLEAVKEGEVFGDKEEAASTVGDKFSQLGDGNSLSGRPGKIPSISGGQSTPEKQEASVETNTAPAQGWQEYKTADITDSATGLKVARGYVPSDYTVDGEAIWCGKWQSLGAPAQVYLTALSPDENTVFGYYSLVCYEHILEYSQNGYSLEEHQDGVFDSQNMCPMLSFMTADAYCDYLAKTILPGQQLEFCTQKDITVEVQKVMDEKANELYQQTASLVSGTGYQVDGTYAGVAEREYKVRLNGYAFKLVMSAVVDGTQMSFNGEFAYNMGSVKHAFISWESPCAYFMLTPEEEYETNKKVYEQFAMNTTVSDQFAQALIDIRNHLAQAGIQGCSSMRDITASCQEGMSASMGTEDTYATMDQFSDYIFEQNDYTLSNGDHVKVPTSYDYVYEGADGNVYVSDSSFDQPGGSVQLYPN